ncbi:MAG: helix-turn-helix transcriptional regulator [Nitrospinae bacterium]|nr:helix-turn-helix transcriptional regulator [Nitrospinota bacterium]MCH7769162.1 helix-turn-helix transcriptional regulator [Nitrospinota bacterium]
MEAELEQVDTIDCEVDAIDPERVSLVLASMIDEATTRGLAEIFRALGDPTRVRILHALAATELCVCDLAAILGMSQSAVSHQLRLLRSLRLVRNRREGRMVYYALDDDHIEKLMAQGLDHVTHG